MKTFSVLLIAALAASSLAQVTFNGGTYTENFNTLTANNTATVSRPTNPTATTNVPGQNWTNDFSATNGTLDGWAITFSNAANVGVNPPSGTNGNFINAGQINTPTPHTIPDYDTRFIRSGTGSSNTGSVYNFGADTNTDRSLGVLNSGGLTTPLISTIGFAIQNTNALALQNFNIGYLGRQWRLGTNDGIADRLDFSYRIFSGGDYAGVTSLKEATGWTDVNALDFSTPTNTGTVGALDGYAAANTVSLSSALSGVVLQPNEILVVRWVDIDKASGDNAMAIDNFSISATPVPEPASIAVLGLGLAALKRRRNRK